MTKREIRQRRRIAEFANTSGDDVALAAISLRTWAAFGVPLPFVDSGHVPSLARAAREIQPDIRAMLRGVVRGASRSDRERAQMLFARHFRHITASTFPVPVLLLRRELKRRFPSLDDAPSQTTGPDLGPIVENKTVDYKDLADALALSLKPEIGRKDFAQFGVCALPACSKFFARIGPRRFCSDSCKSKDRERKPKRRANRRVYMRGYMARKRKRDRERKRLAILRGVS